MLIKFVFLVSLLLISFSSYSQEWLKIVETTKHHYYALPSSFEIAKTLEDVSVFAIAGRSVELQTRKVEDVY